MITGNQLVKITELVVTSHNIPYPTKQAMSVWKV